MLFKPIIIFSLLILNVAGRWYRLASGSKPLEYIIKINEKIETIIKFWINFFQLIFKFNLKKIIKNNKIIIEFINWFKGKKKFTISDINPKNIIPLNTV